MKTLLIVSNRYWKIFAAVAAGLVAFGSAKATFYDVVKRNREISAAVTVQDSVNRIQDTRITQCETTLKALVESAERDRKQNECYHTEFRADVKELLRRVR